MKVLLLGLDGLSFRIIEPYVEAGHLPNFKRLMDSGACGTLRSTIPAVTGPGWTSLSTGKNPGKHGVFEFRRRNGYETEVVTKNTSPHANPLWNILSDGGSSVSIINVPFTFPPDKVNGVMISGLMAPSVDTDFVYPKTIKSELFKLIPDYRFELDEATLLARDKKVLLEKIFKITEDGRVMMNHFADKAGWDFFFTVFIGTDRLQHFFWDEIVAMEPECVRYYRLIDDILGDAMSRVDDETSLLVVSDHGFTKVKKAFYINTFFKEQGLLAIKSSQKVKNKFAKAKITGDNINQFLSRLGLLGLKDRLPERFVNAVKKYLPVKRVSGDEIDWERTKVFSLSDHGIVSINMKGREERGVVEPDDFDEFCDDVKKRLLEVTDPETGERVVKAVYKSDEIYSKEYTDDRPDLVVLMNEGYSIRESIGMNVIDHNRVWNREITGDHELDGVFFVIGPNIKNIRSKAEICDIMPTALYLLGKAIPEDVDGRVMTEVLHDDFVAQNKVAFEKAGKRRDEEENVLADAEKEELERQLRSLGYMG